MCFLFLFFKPIHIYVPKRLNNKQYVVLIYYHFVLGGRFVYITARAIPRCFAFINIRVLFIYFNLNAIQRIRLMIRSLHYSCNLFKPIKLYTVHGLSWKLKMIGRHDVNSKMYYIPPGYQMVYVGFMFDRESSETLERVVFRTLLIIATTQT